MNLVTSGDRDPRVFVGDHTRKEFREKIEAGTIEVAIVRRWCMALVLSS
jgi:hypothetical protein